MVFFKSIRCLVHWLNDNADTLERRNVSMLRSQEAERLYQATERDLALPGKRLRFVQGSKANALPPMLPYRIQDPEMEAFFHLEPMMAAIGVMISFCTLWSLTVFILYQIARIALQATI
jgi:hypothetical protein